MNNHGSEKRRGVPLVVSAPSVTGKTTLCRGVMARLPGLEFSVSHTTRPRRGKEKDGVDYHFVEDPEFETMVSDDAFLEWAAVHGKRYGTSKASVESVRGLRHPTSRWLGTASKAPTSPSTTQANTPPSTATAWPSGYG